MLDRILGKEALGLCLRNIALRPRLVAQKHLKGRSDNLIKEKCSIHQ